MLNGFSIPFWIFTCIVMLVCLGATYYNSRNLSDSNMMTNNLLDVRRRMARAKKFDANWLFLGIPSHHRLVGLVYVRVLSASSSMPFSTPSSGQDVSVVSLEPSVDHSHFKTQRQYQEIIDQIEDLTAEQ